MNSECLGTATETVDASKHSTLTAMRARAIVSVENSLREDKILANLSVRRIDDETVALLRIRAARHGISLEEEADKLLSTQYQHRSGLEIWLYAFSVQLMFKKSLCCRNVRHQNLWNFQRDYRRYEHTLGVHDFTAN